MPKEKWVWRWRWTTARRLWFRYFFGYPKPNLLPGGRSSSTKTGYPAAVVEALLVATRLKGSGTKPSQGIRHESFANSATRSIWMAVS